MVRRFIRYLMVSKESDRWSISGPNLQIHTGAFIGNRFMVRSDCSPLPFFFLLHRHPGSRRDGGFLAGINSFVEGFEDELGVLGCCSLMGSNYRASVFSQLLSSLRIVE
jgi:hypothetical protein